MSSLQDKIYDYEAIPPARVWEQVAAALDESALSQRFPQALHDMEATPPAAVWEKINESLNAPVVEKSTPLLKRLPAFVRYAAAAVLVGAIAFAVIRFSNNKVDDALAGSPALTAPPASAKDSNKNSIVPGKQQPATAVTDQASVKKIPARAERHRVDNRNNLPAIAARQDSPSIEGKGSFSKAIYTYNDHVPSIAERYITLMTPDGGLIRMAKKWSTLLCCVSGEEQDAGCKDQLKKWQEQIAASPVTPAPGNFIDLLNLVSSLEEDTRL